jgi:hypothetical protein
MHSGFAVADRRALPADLPGSHGAGGAPGRACQCRRLQRSRKSGWRMPPGALYCGRPTLNGNPFQIARFGHMKSVNLHRRWLHGAIGALSLERLGFSPAEIDALVRRRGQVLANLHRLATYDFLVCWCALSAPCHVDNLIELIPVYAGVAGLAA